MVGKTRYLVVICNPAQRPGVMANPQISHPAVKTAWVVAAGPEQAADMAKVEAGGHVFVFTEANVLRFERPAVVPLTQTMPDGEALPESRDA